MTKITGYQNQPIQLAVDKKVTRSGETATGAVGTTVASSSGVNITDQARQLASLQQTLQSQPAFDELRVVELRTAIQEGRYEINPERIADRLLRMEQELSV